jgi:hypothetical protein
MNKLSKAKIPKVAFTQHDFDIADRFGKMYMKMLQPNDFDLSDRDSKYFKKLSWLYPMIAEGQPRRKLLAAIEELDGGMWRSQAISLINDAEKLFANVGKTNKKLMRWVQREQLLELIQLVKDEYLGKEIIEDEDEEGIITKIEVFKVPKEMMLQAIETIRRIRADIAKYEQLDKPDEASEDDEMPEINFDESNFDAELAEYEEIAKNTVHISAHANDGEPMEH